MGVDHKWQGIFRAKAAELYPSTDPSHDFLHISRVVATSTKLAAEEGADLNIIIPAAYFHDFVNMPKNDPRRKEASRLSAAAAVEYLRGIGYPEKYFPAIAHAIEAHSFSANIKAETLEAKIVQDADRLDALGAIGAARCFTVGAMLGRPYYDAADMLAEQRAPDDGIYTIDHFFVKLFRIAETLQTKSARAEGARRVAFMKQFLQQMKSEAA